MPSQLPILKNIRLFLLGFLLLLGLNVHAQQLNAVGWGQRLGIDNQDGRAEEFWLNNGEVWHRYR